MQQQSSKIFTKNEINVRICLIPEELDHNYLERLFILIKKKYEKTCLKNIGYIYQILKIKQIVHEEIMKMIPNVIFVVKIIILSYLPKEKDEIELYVEHIFHHGIFGGIDKIKILVPIQSCNDYIISNEKDKSRLFLIHRNDQTKMIKMNQTILVQLQKIRFEKDNFSCLAKLL